MAIDSSYASLAPSTVPLYGAPLGVNAMTPAQLTVYLRDDVSLSPTLAIKNNGLAQRIRDGRISGQQDYIDLQFIRAVLGRNT
jgi:hypothetical protein